MRVAGGRSSPRGWAIECRITSEDPANGFLPSTGRIEYLRVPAGPGVRWDGGVDIGDEVTLYYDSLLAKLIVWAPDRARAHRTGCVRALDELVVVGVATNQAFHRRLFARCRRSAPATSTSSSSTGAPTCSSPRRIRCWSATSPSPRRSPRTKRRQARRPVVADGAGVRAPPGARQARARRAAMTAPAVRIQRLAAGGDGVGRAGGRPGGVRAADRAGELVELRDVRPARRFARARAARIVEPSPDRVEPRCRPLHRRRLRRLPAAASRPAGAASGAPRHRRRCPPPARPARRRRPGAGAGGAGFRVPHEAHARGGARRAPDRTPPARPARCGLRTRALPSRRRAADGSVGAPAGTADPAPGRPGPPGAPARPERRAAPDRQRARDRGLDRAAELGARARALGRPLGSLVASGGGRRSRRGGPERRPPAPVFEQVHPAMGDRVRALALERLGPVAGARVWDLYAGIGETTAALAGAGAPGRERRAGSAGRGACGRRRSGAAAAPCGRGRGDRGSAGCARPGRDQPAPDGNGRGRDRGHRGAAAPPAGLHLL